MDAISKLTRTIVRRLNALGARPPAAGVVDAVLNVAYATSLMTEEGRFLRAAITYADPSTVDQDGPILKRADYPSFTAFGQARPLLPGVLVKLARAVNSWSGSIAVWGSAPKTLAVWGVVDQLVGANTHLNRESEGGFASPGVFTVVIENPGSLAVYHGWVFLGAVRSQDVILKETDVLGGSQLQNKISPYLLQTADAVTSVLQGKCERRAILRAMLETWESTIARICIGLRRVGTGASLLIAQNPRFDLLSIVNRVEYSRLRDSLALNALDDAYLAHLRRTMTSQQTVSKRQFNEFLLAQTDAHDRTDEVNGAVKLVTSLAAVDGAVLLTPDLSMIGFGVKIGGAHEPDIVYDGEDFARRRRQARKVALDNFGTRHASILRYCASDPEAIGIIISQDGHVRVAMTLLGSVVLWDRVQLLGHTIYSSEMAKEVNESRGRRARLGQVMPRKMGYSPMPKKYRDLLSALAPDGGQPLDAANGPPRPRSTS